MSNHKSDQFGALPSLPLLRPQRRTLGSASIHNPAATPLLLPRHACTPKPPLLRTFSHRYNSPTPPPPTLSHRECNLSALVNKNDKLIHSVHNQFNSNILWGTTHYMLGRSESDKDKTMFLATCRKILSRFKLQ